MSSYDVAVVGAGIVGLAVAREVVRRRPGASVVVLEKESHLAAHQSGHNSGVIHGGIYYQPGSAKARLCVEGARLMYEYCQEHEVRHERCGKLIVAVRPDELPRLRALEERGRGNGVPGLRRVGPEEIAEIEPDATGLAALHAPGTGIVSYAEVAAAIGRELEGQGVELRFRAEVTAIDDGSRCRITVARHGGEPGGATQTEVVTATEVVACAGLWSDRLARRSGARSDPRIVPFRGAYLRLSEGAGPRIRGMVYPVPDPALPFLGVHLTRHIDGHTMLGPTAMMVPSRDGYLLRTVRGRDVWETLTWPGTWRVARSFWRTGLQEVRMATSRRAYVRQAAAYVPRLKLADLDGSFHAGVRAQAVGRDGTLVDDFVISGSGAVTHVRNAPSPAGTSAFALAAEILDRVEAAAR
jgi:L-2-hydroxyglutarate oxidase LhgO